MYPPLETKSSLNEDNTKTEKESARNLVTVRSAHAIMQLLDEALNDLQRAINGFRSIFIGAEEQTVKATICCIDSNHGECDICSLLSRPLMNTATLKNVYIELNILDL
uniref:Uncharacterized protein n=1 Tax=Glossina morsitans morsitans TaxID=37546 RepID=A0A1B0G464_GLOMM